MGDNYGDTCLLQGLCCLCTWFDLLFNSSYKQIDAVQHLPTPAEDPYTSDASCESFEPSWRRPSVRENWD